MMRQWSSPRVQGMAVLVLILAASTICFSSDSCTLLSADQKAYHHFKRGDYQQAAQQFVDPAWKGVAYFKQGEFKQAAGMFAGFDTAPAAFNQGNALLMLGKYEDAVKRYERALELKPGWEDALINRDIAQGRAKRVEKKGGEMTGGKMEADDFVFSKNKAPASAGEEQVSGEQPISDQALRAIWLRNVQTKPADFLRAKFAYQYATHANGNSNTEVKQRDQAK
ncbi:MAG: tetratricopeptide repeat protein [Gammaproteobacteria bacterium]